MESEQEIRLRCLEAAARNPVPHKDGYAAGVLGMAQEYAKWVAGEKLKLAGAGVFGGKPDIKPLPGVDSLF